MADRTSPRDFGDETRGTGGPFPGSEFSDEPFPCPACGQMLAPTCRVCVACKKPIDPAQIREAQPAPATAELRVISPPRERVHFSWMFFFTALAAWLFAAMIAQRLLGPARAQLVLGAAVILSSAWVYFDAQAKRVPKPLRWALGSLLLWIVVFPWYLARRRTPEWPCSFVEAETGPVARVLLFALLFFFLLGAIILIFNGTPPR